MTFSKYREEYGGTTIGVIVLLASLFAKPNWGFLISYTKDFSSIGLSIFGFTLTLLAIILQSDNTTIQYLKSKKDLFEKFIEYNKRIVILSIFLAVYSYLVLHIKLPEFLLNNLSIIFINWVKIIIASLFFGMQTKLFIDIYFFLKNFYILIKQ